MPKKPVTSPRSLWLLGPALVAGVAALVPLGLGAERPLAICSDDPRTFPDAGVAGASCYW